MHVPLPLMLSHISGLLFSLPRSFVGRFHRRRGHRQIRLHGGTRATRATWWGAEPRWFPSGTAPRRASRLTPLVDGQEAFTAILEAIRHAEHYVYICGWTLTPAFALDPQAPDGMLATVLADISPRLPVKVLVWSGSQLLFPPSRHIQRLMRHRLLEHAPHVECRLDSTAHPTHCHHQKAIVVDGQIAFVGGLDLTTLDGDRWDTPAHAMRPGPNWHDVMLQVEGDAVTDVEANFVQRWTAVSGRNDLIRRPPQSEPAWSTPCQIVRTIPRRVYPFARRGEFGIAHAYLAAIAAAKHFVYLENQYIWAPEIVDALIAAMERNARSRFRIALVLPARAYLGKYDNDQHVQRLRAADAGRGMFTAYSLYTGGPSAGLAGFSFRPIYVHAKVAIIDDEWYTVGSANLNRRSLATDSELNAHALDPCGARALRLRLWGEHLLQAADELADVDPCDVLDRIFPPRAAAVQSVVAQGWGRLPAHLHPYQSGRTPGRGLLQEIESSLVEGV